MARDIHSGTRHGVGAEVLRFFLVVKRTGLFRKVSRVLGGKLASCGSWFLRLLEGLVSMQLSLRRFMSASVGSEREGLKGFCPSVMIWNSHGFDLTLELWFAREARCFFQDSCIG